MKNLHLLLIALSFLMVGCYTQVVYLSDDSYVKESGVDSTVQYTTHDSYVGYGYRYPDLYWGGYYGYQPYWYDGFYTPWYKPYRGYIIPHRPIWRFPFHYNPPKRFGDNWVKPKPTPPKKEPIRFDIPRRGSPLRSFIQSQPRISFPSRNPVVRENPRSSNERSPMVRENLRSGGENRGYVPQHNTAPQAPVVSPPANSGGNRSSGATRSGRER